MSATAALEWSAIGEATRRLAVSIWPWAAFFQGTYWICRLIAPMTFTTYNKLERDKRGYWCSSMVSSMLACIITPLSIRALWRDSTLAAGDDFFYATPESQQAIRVFLGYITSDLMLSIYYRARWPGWIENLLHHLCIMLTWGIFLDRGAGNFLACVAHICEITTPFVNQRWFMYEAGLKSSRTYFYNGLCMLALWFFSRILLYSYAGVRLAFSMQQLRSLGPAATTTVVTCYTAGLTLQYFWFYKIVRGALKSLRGSSSSASEVSKSEAKQVEQAQQERRRRRSSLGEIAESVAAAAVAAGPPVDDTEHDKELEDDNNDNKKTN